MLWGAWLHCITDANQDLCRSLKFTTPLEGHALVGHVIKNLSIGIHASCKHLCTMESQCVSFNIGPPTNARMLCQLSDSDHNTHSENLKPKEGFIYRATQNACLTNLCTHNGTCLNGFTSKGYLCECKPGFAGENCEKVINNCLDAFPTTGKVEIFNHGPELFPVYCDQTHDDGGWMMVFKVVGGVSSPKVGELWHSSSVFSENVRAALDTTASHLGHYKNRIVQDWTTFNPQEARVVLYENGNEVVSLKFNAGGTNNLNWFSQENLISSPWSDLKTAANLQHFDLTGSYGRYIEISRPYSHCNTDSGWLVITSVNDCDWETRVPVQSIQYSKLGNSVVWNDYGNVGIADVLAVFVR
ncbi:hypothetical protein ACROYT_G022894 [Oculina patagonica]